MLKEGIVLGERYEIISRIGAGGMADVYKVQDHKLNRLVAAKVMKAEFREDAGFVVKFQKEAQAAAKLSHPNVVNVYDVGEDRGLYYIVMELVEGITLKNYIARKGKLSVKEATSIAIQVSLGLEAAHNVGIVHRDVKPQNIMISTDGKVKLSDFGIAKAINSNTITANVMGSVHYSSPEQVRGGISDAKSDIYSLGITMYEMVTGRVPFDGDTTVAIAIKHLQEEIVPPSIYTPDLPYSLEQIILKCTQKDPNRRYSNVGDMIDDLKHSLIDPQGNFVTLAPLSAPGAQKAPAADPNMARQRVNPEQRRVSRSESSERERAAAEMERRRNRERYIQPDDDPDEDEEASGLEKAVTIGGFIIGAVIILILILVIGNMAGIFHFGKNNQQVNPTVTPTATPTPTATAQVTVPDLRGMTLEQATLAANERSIGVRQAGFEASESVVEGAIISQSPEANSSVNQGTTIEVVLSSGRPVVTIPVGLAGLPLDQVRSQIEGLGLQTKEEQQNSATVEIGNVISVNPSEGSSVATGSIVTIYVSKGPDTSSYVDVPSVVGQDQATAVATLQTLGLSPTIANTTNEAFDYGIVLDQTNVGENVPRGTQITLTVNNFQTPTPAPEEPQGEKNFVCYSPLSRPDGYTGGYVELILVQGMNSSTIYAGPDPWTAGDFTTPIESTSGETGEIDVYEEGILIARYPNVVFEPKL
ncbi:MAG: Stk1 family PASTA domain-containing Ser/Thr kinase [Eubacterium sp.]|nr:Stk1 family PASTA domain-containing Ser/Thr kinase [Eubacterium sp.]